MLHTLTALVQPKQKRVGRGYGSGRGGHTSGRGTKGTRARKSGEAPLWFEGGALPMVKRMPMIRGKARFNVVRPTAEVTLDALQRMSAKTITLETLKVEKVIHARFSRAKIIATGSLKRAVQLEGLSVSATAKKMIEKAGGSVR
jgi:large subunit ribosomal protein L15